MRTLSVAALLIIPLIISQIASATDQIKVLLISGQNNHNWRVTTPLIVSALKVTERFEVVVCNEIEKMNRDLSKIEKIKKFIIVDKQFSIENGFMTPTLKLKRYKIIQEYKKNLEKLYN